MTRTCCRALVCQTTGGGVQACASGGALIMHGRPQRRVPGKALDAIVCSGTGCVPQVAARRGPPCPLSSKPGAPVQGCEPLAPGASDQRPPWPLRQLPMQRAGAAQHSTHCQLSVREHGAHAADFATRRPALIEWNTAVYQPTWQPTACTIAQTPNLLHWWGIRKGSVGREPS